MIVCTEKDDDFIIYKDKVKNRKVLYKIKDIFADWWDNYKIEFAHRKRRPIIDKVISKFLLCKSFELGYSLYECPTCHEEKVVPHTCKTRFCSSCGNKYNEARAISIHSKLFNAKHRHVVFTIPEELRKYFRNNRGLLNLLFQASADTIKSWFKDKYKKQNLTPAFISVLHTFGRPLNFNPHIHMILLDGGVSKDKFVKVDFFSYAALRKRWMKLILDLLKNEIPSNEFRTLKNKLYSTYKDGFYVYAPKCKFKSVKGLLDYVCRYLSRPVMAESRILDYDGEYVTFWYQRHEDNIIVVEKLHAHEFIQRLIMHIPEPNFKYIRFYGAYHNSTRINIEMIKLINDERIKLRKKWNTWRYKILINFEIDPLYCPKCHEEMVYYKSYYI